MIPVNVRSDDEKGALGNRVSMMLPELPVGIANRAERLAAVRGEMERLKAHNQADAFESLMRMAENLPAAYHALAGIGGVPPGGANLVCTNVPGPMIPLYSVGHRMLEHYPIVPLAGDHGHRRGHHQLRQVALPRHHVRSRRSSTTSRRSRSTPPKNSRRCARRRACRSATCPTLRDLRATGTAAARTARRKPRSRQRGRRSQPRPRRVLSLGTGTTGRSECSALRLSSSGHDVNRPEISTMLVRCCPDQIPLLWNSYRRK